MTSPIVIDTDPGIDDALAIAFSFSAGLPIESVTTVYGNSDIHNVTRNAGFIIRSLGAEWSIHRGATKPLVSNACVAESHGGSGLGNKVPAESEIVKPADSTAEAALTSLLESSDRVTLFCLGPLTNIAGLLQSRGELAQKIDRLIIMEGAFREKGNVTEFAEFNCYNDPEAFQIVIDAARDNHINTAIIPAEVCRKVTLTRADIEPIKQKGLLPNIDAIVEPFIDYYMNDEIHGGFDGAVLYDVLVPLYYQQPELFTVQPVSVTVEQQGLKRGMTTYCDDDESTVKLCLDVQAVKAKQFILQALA